LANVALLSINCSGYAASNNELQTVMRVAQAPVPYLTVVSDTRV